MNRSSITILAVVLVILAVAGPLCAGPKPRIFGYEAWREAVIEIGLDPEEVVFPFHITEEMAAWAKEKITGHQSQLPEVRLEILQRSFFDPGEFEFEYDVIQTLTARQAFEERQGNCMSFTSLFVALSREVGLPTFLMSVKRPPEVIRDGGLVVVNRHVVAGFRAPNKVHIYDFYVTDTGPHISQRVLNDLEASAIYHTNIGGTAIREGDNQEALRNLEIAVRLSPRWAPAWVNLGVARARVHDVEGSFDALQRALEVEPNNSSALVNLSNLYRDQGRDEEAETAMRAAAESTRNPFTLIAMADVEITRGNLEEARQYLRRARWWYGKEPEVHDALARLARAEGDENRATKHARRAAEIRIQIAQEEEDRTN